VRDDEIEEEFYQRYPSRQARRGPSIFASIVTSVLTTVALFFGLRELDARGFFDGKEASTAPGAVEVPNVVGVRLEQARELLKGKGLLITISEEREDATSPAGSIVSQNPLAGSETQPGTTVQVVLARPVATVLVPPVAGLKPEEAMRQIAAKGLQLGPQKNGQSETVAAGMVIETEPSAGSAVAPGSAVTLVVAALAGNPVPKLVGKRLQRAKKILEDAGFKLGKTKFTYDACCGEYVILKQEPAEGVAAPRGTAVDLVVNEPG
jgi:eukaryotic-like serine/threonine-protein kinase